MTEKGLYRLQTDEDFKRLITPLSAEERKQLELSIIHDGCRDALVVWSKTIIDGHNRYEICTRREIPFEIENINFNSREEALAWICRNQLGRLNISEETRRYLIGKRYEMEIKLNEQLNASVINQHAKKEVRHKNDAKPKNEENATRIRERLAKEYRVGTSTVERYGIYANALDEIEKAAPEFHKKIMSGQLKVTQDNIIRISRLTPSEIISIGSELTENPNAYFAYTDNRGEILKNTPNKVQLELMNIGAIKEMPKHDPDAEILSLAFTVPSWVGSINRVSETTKFTDISESAREKIMTVLYELKSAIDRIICEIEEEK